MKTEWKVFEMVSWKDCLVTGGFWQKRQVVNETVTLPAVYEFFRRSGRMDCMKGLYKPSADGRDILRDRANGKEEGVFLPGGKVILYSLAQLLGETEAEPEDNRAPRPHQYWDSDVAKWIEGAAYALRHRPNPATEKIIDDIVDAYEKIQGEDGYLNTYFTFVEPGKRFTNLQEKHELYCAGHMLEAAIAYYEATGKEKYLQLMIRYIDYIDSVIGPEEGKIHGYPGHQELELALIRLYRLAGNEKYLRLARYFLDERGKQPLFFDEECRRENRNPNLPTGKGFGTRNGMPDGPYAHFQSHLPVREQKEAVGHAVRLMYQCIAMTDAAVESGDAELLQAAETLWNNVTLEKMYITGGVGAESHGERFAFSYHLPNESSYNETCAAIGLAMWAARMLQTAADIRYSDVLERVVYNGVISGLSLSGDSYFYANHLQCMPAVYENRIERQTRMFPVRQADFPVSCCPANLTRFTESVGGYAMTRNEGAVYVHLYMDSETTVRMDGQEITLIERTAYPWEEKIVFRIQSKESCAFTLGLRIPGWCREYTLTVNGKRLEGVETEKGYVRLYRDWRPDDTVELVLFMQPTLMEANPNVRMDCGRAAIQCGPFVYCLEEEDNGKNLFDITIGGDVIIEKHYDPNLLGGTTYLTANAWRRKMDRWQGALYKPLGSGYEPCRIKAIPYYLWSNRRIGEMIVWLRYR